MEYIESETVELKSIFVDDIKKEIISFANASGGKIFIGIGDDGAVCGIDNPDEIIRKISNSVRDTISPDITMFIHYVIREEKGKYIVEVDISEGTHKPYYLLAKGMRPEGVFIRQGTSSVQASEMLIRKLVKESDNDCYESACSSEQNLTFEKAKSEFSKRNMPFEEAQMKTLGLINGYGLYTNLALLVSDQCPHTIKAATFAGIDTSDFQDRCEFSGSIFQQLDEAYSYMRMRNSTSASFEGLLRIDHRSYPDTAQREALLNGIIHRDYGISASTLLRFFENRMEIISVGGLAGGISYDDMMLGVSYCRNSKLANIFYRLELIESYGTGMDKIMRSYNDFTKKPIIQVTSGAYKITLPNMNCKQQNEAMVTKQNGKMNKDDQIVDLIKKNNVITRQEAEKYLNVSSATVIRLLRSLVESGIIKKVGNGNNVSYVLA